MMFKLKATILTCLLAVLFWTLPQSAQAEESLNITVSPFMFDLVATPGATLKDKVRLYNNLSSPLTLQVSVKKLVGSEISEVVLAEPDPGDEFINWLKLETNTLTAKPKEWTDFSFTLSIPTQAAFGYYLAIAFKQEGVEAEPGEVATTGGVVIPILLNVQKEGAKPLAKLIEFAPKSFINEYLPVDFTVKINNIGNLHVKPRGNIFIRSGDKDLAVLEVNQKQSNILPGAIRGFESNWSDGFLVRKKIIEGDKVKLNNVGVPITTLGINWDKLTSFRLGHYTASLLMVYDGGNQDITLEGTTSFWVIPYKIIGGLVTAVLVLIFSIRFLLKKYIRSQIKKQNT